MPDATEPQPQRREADRGEVHGRWNSQGLWQRMSPWLPGLEVEVLSRIGSTNTELIERARQVARRAAGREARADDLQPTLLIAEQQTQGKGRLGRPWFSSPEASLTFSLALPLQRADWSGLSLAVGLALARALDPDARRLRLKWPNDLWLADAGGGGRKLGGVLIEALTLGTQRLAVIGVGLNVRPQVMAGAALQTAALSECWPDARPQAVMAAIGPALAEALAGFEQHGFAPLAAAFAARDLLIGQPVTTSDPACPEGIAEGVAEDGALCVRRAGQLHRIVSGEISVRPARAAGGG